jgi:hypothetical protein
MTYETFTPRNLDGRAETEAGKKAAELQAAEQAEIERRHAIRRAQMTRFNEYCDFLDERQEAYREQGVPFEELIYKAHADLEKKISPEEYKAFNDWLDQNLP